MTADTQPGPPHEPLPPGPPSGQPPEPSSSYPQVPTAAVRARKRRISLIWIIPIVTLAIGVYLAVTTLREEGPTIEITFETAEGLKSGQSQIRHKDVVLGTVRSIRLSDDYTHVIVTAEMRRGIDALLTDSAKIWVVKPRFFAGNISGLDTLLGGSYIDLLPGTVPGTPTHSFTGLEEPPVLTANTPGRTVLVRAPRIGSISAGSPVFFRDLLVGQVLGWDVGELANYVTLHVFIRAPFDRYLQAHTRFWNASGVNVSLGGNGVQVQMESLRAVLLGGIAFDNPPEANPEKADPQQVFNLYKDEETASSAAYGRELEFESLFENSVRGLSVGATVDLRGIKIGQVTAISLRYDPQRDKAVVPVRYTVQPDRIANNGLAASGNMEQAMRDLVRRGLRARLVSSNLITGAQTISLDLEPDAPPAELGRDGDLFVIPSVQGGGIESITATASALLEKINSIPFREIGNNLNGTLAGLNGIANGRELHEALTNLQSALSAVQDFTQKLEHDTQPALARLPAIAQGLQDTVARANKLLGGVDTGYGGDSRFKRDLDRLLAQLNDTASSVRVLADLLTRHPEALIRGRTSTGVQ